MNLREVREGAGLIQDLEEQNGEGLFREEDACHHRLKTIIGAE